MQEKIKIYLLQRVKNDWLEVRDEARLWGMWISYNKPISRDTKVNPIVRFIIVQDLFLLIFPPQAEEEEQSLRPDLMSKRKEKVFCPRC